MIYDFYQSKKYKEKQSAIIKENWRKGLFDFHFKREERVCAREGCHRIFKVIPSDPKIYCSKNCAARVNNVKGGSRPDKIKLKIAKALKGRKNPHKGTKRVPRIETICANPRCKKIFLREPWVNRKFCSNKCVMEVISRRPTSPKAARGKAGIRTDISKTIYFYSRWEANVARLFEYLGIKWIHQAKTFDLVSQTYTPDFYLPERDIEKFL
ncbi:hypothetical protein KAU51_01570 [Candidatus Parcubacteria bacterium]|nr:hypothetical protein [Candidatus Parcubacteria bacterium]